MLKFFFLISVCILHTISAWCVNITISTHDVSCYEGEDGTLTVKLTNRIPDYEYTLRLYDKTPAMKQKVLQTLIADDSVFVFSNLSAKKYYVQIVDVLRDKYQAEATIQQPERITYIDYEVIKEPSSETSSDGSIGLFVKGGVPPYSYKWSYNANRQTTKVVQNISYDIYQCEISDANKCRPQVPTIIFKKEFLKLKNEKQ